MMYGFFDFDEMEEVYFDTLQDAIDALRIYGHPAFIHKFDQGRIMESYLITIQS